VDCKECQEQVTAAVDRQLTESQMRAFLCHVGGCPSCRRDFEAESDTKAVVCAHLGMVHTPSGLMTSIVDGLHTEEAAQAGWLHALWRRITASVYFRPALVFAAGCLAVLLLVRDSARNPPGNIIEQSMTNYAAVVNGSILPQITGSEPERVLDFFSGKTEFPVLVPRISHCELVGGVVNEYAGVKLAHVVYRHDREVVYIYQACWEEVQKGERLHLPAEVRDQLRSTGWYSAMRPDGNAIVLWTKGRTLCSAVAHMPKDELLACLTEGERTVSTPW
jgi:hypothetical protein